MSAATLPSTTAALESASLAIDIFAASDRPWAITPRALEALIRAAQSADYEAVAARAGQPLQTRGAVENFNGTAVVDIRGPLFRYRSIWTWLLGATSVEETSLDLHAALDDPSVSRIVLAINSPGGQIDGINELANMIRAANSVKPVTAYVDGLAGSGAYWLASAAGRIVADETSQLGSIGVLATVTDDGDAQARRGVKRYDVVSSQSPLKRSDPGTDEGRAQMQRMVDGLAQLFIAAVAKFRGTSETKVAGDFGRGAVLPARDAVAVGMADSLGSLEAVIKAQQTGPVRQIRNAPGLRMAWLGNVAVGPVVDAPFDEDELEEETEETQLNNAPGCDCPDEECECNGDDEDESEGTEQEPDDSSIPEGESRVAQPTEPTQPPQPTQPAQQPTQQQQRTVVNTERQRIAAILNCEEARGREELARTLALDTNLSLAAAQKILTAAPQPAPPAAPNPLAAAMAQVPNPRVGVPAEERADDSPAAEIQRVLAFVPKDRLRAHARAN